MIVRKDLPDCPVATTIGIIGNKWKLLILRNLLAEPQRFTDLLNNVDGISKKVLTENLKSLENDGVINRQVFANEIPIRVEYSLSDIGQSLNQVFDLLSTWGNNYKELIKKYPYK